MGHYGASLPRFTALRYGFLLPRCFWSISSRCSDKHFRYCDEHDAQEHKAASTDRGGLLVQILHSLASLVMTFPGTTMLSPRIASQCFRSSLRNFLRVVTIDHPLLE